MSDDTPTTSDAAFAAFSLDDLVKRRNAMELEMQAISARLTAPGAPGLRGRLVDDEGFPIAGCDLYAVRADRGRYSGARATTRERAGRRGRAARATDRPRFRVAVLRNDYVRLNDELASRVASRMAEGAVRTGMERLDVTPATEKQPPPSVASSDEDVGRAFCVIDEIAEGCPGEIDGLRVGDRVCAVGNVRWGFEDPSSTPPAGILNDAARAFAESEGATVRVVVLRRGELVVVRVTPRTWSGRGLVGCHMRPV